MATSTHLGTGNMGSSDMEMSIPGTLTSCVKVVFFPSFLSFFPFFFVNIYFYTWYSIYTTVLESVARKLLVVLDFVVKCFCRDKWFYVLGEKLIYILYI